MSERRGKRKPGPSHLYMRLLRGEVNSWHYARVLMRAVNMAVARERRR